MSRLAQSFSLSGMPKTEIIWEPDYETKVGWYLRIDPDPESGSPICDAIIDRIINNAYEILVDGKHSMHECYGLKAEDLE